MIRTGVVGLGGRMGTMIANLLLDESQTLTLAGASEMPSSPLVGKDAGYALRRADLGFNVAATPVEAFQDCDVFIDFSAPKASLQHAAYAAATGKALVIGTTGMNEDERAQVAACAVKTPIVLAPNMSIGVNVMFKVAAELTRLLGEDYDIEIVEAHHRHKKDAPSGTADGLARSIAAARGVNLSEHACYERHGIIGERPRGEIGIQTLRGGDIIGDHTVLYAGNSERIELTHRAHTRENFARGALRAAEWLVSKQPGLYDMLDVLGLS
ncbi:MAG: 4-hydroxy-tetrahydrodipicolinate reductase [Deltaproteobacteria bacterium ADurb.Bin510]|nr:MAG: 4-hydroxy-tetrahydrodipicolinate reductase [Deltaproteobacteria bacterium ADurb.Bin510]